MLRRAGDFLGLTGFLDTVQSLWLPDESSGSDDHGRNDDGQGVEPRRGPVAPPHKPSLRQRRAAIIRDKREILQLWSRIRREQGLEISGFDEEVATAHHLYNEAVDYTKHFLTDVQEGKKVDCREAVPIVDQMIESVFRNQSAVISLAKLRTHDEYTFSHSINVSVFAIIFGRHLGYSQDRLRVLGLAGIYHDVGKTLIPENILNKPERLTPSEFRIIQKHTLRGYESMKDNSELHQEVLRCIVQHHEHHDGTGYPFGLRGEKISPLARIISLVDVFDALTSNRVYRKGLTQYEAMSIIFKDIGRKFPPELAERFIKSLGIFPVGSLVRLSDGRFAVVRKSHPTRALYPTVRVLFNEDMTRTRPMTIDLSEALEEGSTLRILGCVDPTRLGVNPRTLLS